MPVKAIETQVGVTKPGDCVDESGKHGGEVDIIGDSWAGDSSDTQPIKQCSGKVVRNDRA